MSITACYRATRVYFADGSSQVDIKACKGNNEIEAKQCLVSGAERKTAELAILVTGESKRGKGGDDVIACAKFVDENALENFDRALGKVLDGLNARFGGLKLK